MVKFILLCLSMALGGLSLITQQDPQPAKIDPRNHYLLSEAATLVNRSHDFAVAAPGATTSTGALICGPGNPCIDGSCCGSNNLCGYGFDYCGKGCQSQCDATAPCGRDSAGGAVHCGMNLCCSYYGWCGVTADFCTPGNAGNGNVGCQQGFGSCQTHDPFQCGGNSAQGRSVGYFQGGNVLPNERKCQKITPDMIKTEKYTHLIWAFAEIDPTTFKAVAADPIHETLWRDFTALKSSKLQTWIGIGGFDFTTANPHAWSQMVSTAANRQSFITSLVDMMNQFGFQGVDLDWEYPVDSLRNGSPDDMKNLVQLLADMRANFGHNFGISVTLAPDPWYLQHYDAKGLLANADFLGFMSYDLHGMWDADVVQLGKKVYGQTNVHDIERDLIPLWYDLTPADLNKVNFGLTLYGRGYTLADPSCNRADGSCAWTDSSKPGPCTATTGVMSLVEIEALIKDKNLTPQPLVNGKGDTLIKQITWDDQWMGYDDTDTITAKTQFASSRCFGGTMSWSMDLEVGSLDNVGDGVSKAPPPPPPITDSCFWGPCERRTNIGCPSGSTAKTYRLRHGADCVPRWYFDWWFQAYCCPDSAEVESCEWKGGSPAPCGSPNNPNCLPCDNNVCADDENLVLFDEQGDTAASCNKGQDPKTSKGYALCCKVPDTGIPWWERVFQGIYWQDMYKTCNDEQQKILIEATRMADEMVNAFAKKTPDDITGSSAFNRYFYATPSWGRDPYFQDLMEIYENINSTARFPKIGKGNSRGKSTRAQKVSYYCSSPDNHLPDFCIKPPPNLKPGEKWAPPTAYTSVPSYDRNGWSITLCESFFNLCYLNDVTKIRYKYQDIAGMNNFEWALAHEWMHAQIFGYPTYIDDQLYTNGTDQKRKAYGDRDCFWYARSNAAPRGLPETDTSLNADTYALSYQYDWYHDWYKWDDQQGAWRPN